MSMDPNLLPDGSHQRTEYALRLPRPDGGGWFVTGPMPQAHAEAELAQRVAREEQAVLVRRTVTTSVWDPVPDTAVCAVCGEPGRDGTDRCNLHTPLKGNIEVRRGGDAS